MMKQVIPLFSLLLILTILACQRDADITPNPPPTDTTTVPPVDTIDSNNVNKDTTIWQKISTNMGGIENIYFLSEAKGFCATDQGLYATLDSGKTWSGKIANEHVVNIYFIDEKNGYCTGSRYGYTKDGGETWTVLPTRFGYSRYVFFTNLSSGFISNNNGLYQSLDSGKTWNLISTTACSGIYFTDSLNGWLTTINPAKIQKTTDGGKTFTDSWVGQAQDFYYTIQFADSLHGWVSNTNKTIYKTGNGGNSWEQVLMNKPIIELHFLNKDIGFIATNDGVSKSTDGGNSWKHRYTNPMSAPTFLSPLSKV